VTIKLDGSYKIKENCNYMAMEKTLKIVMQVYLKKMFLNNTTKIKSNPLILLLT